eukprot:7839484-Alexandrium_andersonii.AAC.1
MAPVRRRRTGRSAAASCPASPASSLGKADVARGVLPWPAAVEALAALGDPKPAAAPAGAALAAATVCLLYTSPSPRD